MGCKRLTEGEYNKIKKVANAHRVEWLSEKYGYGATVIRQIRRSKNWKDYEKQFIEKKRIERILAKQQSERIQQARKIAKNTQALKFNVRKDKHEAFKDIVIATCTVLATLVLLIIISIVAIGGMNGH